MIGAVAVLASFKQMSFLAHLMRWKSYFIVVATWFCFMSVWFTFLTFSLLFLEISWDQVSDVSFTMPFWSGFCGFHELLSWCSQFFSNPGDADKHGIICHGPWQHVCHKSCLICVFWHWGIPRILKYSTKSMSMKPMFEASGLVRSFNFTDPTNKLPKYRYPPPCLLFLGVLTCPLKKKKQHHYIDRPIWRDFGGHRFVQRSPFSEASSPNPFMKGRPWECHITTKS